MTKENYIQLRQSGQLSMELLWEYYVSVIDEGQRRVKDFGLFMQVFPVCMSMGQFNFDNVIKYFDNKFSLNILRNKDEQIIKVY